MGALDDALKDLDAEAVGTKGQGSTPKPGTTVPSSLPEAPSLASLQDAGLSPDQPNEHPPLSLGDKMALAVGNTAGSIAYLRKSFPAAQQNANGDLVVQGKDGVWSKVRPDLLGKGDAWDKTQAILNFIPDIAKGEAAAVLGAAGATAGSIVPGAGTVAGGAGGAALGAAGMEGVKQSLGRLVGTYEATPEEAVRDMGWDALYGVGGHAVALGAKPLLSGLASAGKAIGQTATSGARAALEETLGATTGTGASAMRTLFDNAGEVVGKMKGFLSTAADGAAAHAEAASQALSKSRTFLDTATDALSTKYGSLLEDLKSAAGTKNMKVDFQEVMSQGMQALENLGIGKFENEEGKFAFRALSEAEKDGLVMAGKSAPEIPPEAMARAQQLASELNRFSKVGELEGSVATDRLVAFNKRLKQLSKSAYQSGSAEFQQAVTESNNAIKTAIKNQFSKNGLGNEYQALSQVYDQYGSAVQNARDILGSKMGPENLVKKLTSEAGRHSTVKGDSQLLKSLVNEIEPGKGDALYKDIITTDAAGKFARAFPRVGVLQGIEGLALAQSPGGLMAKAALATGTAAVSSPRLVANAVGAVDSTYSHPIAQSAMKMLSKLGPEQAQKFLQSETALPGLVQIVGQGISSQQQTTKDLLNQAGSFIDSQKPIQAPNQEQ